MSVMQVVVLSPFLLLQDLSTGGQFNGVLVDCDTVLTVAHAVKDDSQVYCTAQAENHFVTFRGRVIKRNLRQDLALVRIENHVVYQVAPLVIADQCGQQGELYGWERLGKFRRRKAMRLPDATSDGETITQWDTEAVSGLSGSAFLDQGKIIGIQSCGSRTTYCATVEQIREFVGR